MNSVTKIPSCLARLVARPWDTLTNTSVCWSSSSGPFYSLTDRLRSIPRWREMGFPVPPCSIPSNQPAKLYILCVRNNTALNDVFSLSLSCFPSSLLLCLLCLCLLVLFHVLSTWRALIFLPWPWSAGLSLRHAAAGMRESGPGP